MAVFTTAETAGEKAYRRIRTDIIFGRLAPGQKLKLDGLKEAYGVSVSTLREMLNRLTAEGLIVAENARGFEVASVSAQNMKEVANLRQLLECHALPQGTWSGKAGSSRRTTNCHKWKSG
jgi:DNA-binding GntR family transcriptional regulator